MCVEVVTCVLKAAVAAPGALQALQAARDLAPRHLWPRLLLLLASLNTPVVLVLRARYFLFLECYF